MCTTGPLFEVMGTIVPDTKHHFRYHFPHQRQQSRCTFTNCALALVPFLIMISFTGSNSNMPTEKFSARVVRTTVICDDSTFTDCSQNRELMTEAVAQYVNDTWCCNLAVNVSVLRLLGHSPGEFRSLWQILQEMAPDVIVAVGIQDTVHMVTILADGLNKPVLGYVTNAHETSAKPLEERIYVSGNTDAVSQGRALALLIGESNMPHTFLLIQDIFLGDGFLSGFKSTDSARHPEVFVTLTLRVSMTDYDLKTLLEELAMKSWKIVVLHCQPQLMQRLVTQADAMRLFAAGHGWFLSENALTLNRSVLRTLPEGLLGLHSFYNNGTGGVLAAAAISVACAYQCMQECEDYQSVTSVPLDKLSPSYSSSSQIPSSVPERRLSSLLSTSAASSLLEQPRVSPVPRPSSSTTTVLSYAEISPFQDVFRVSCDNSTQYFVSCARFSPLCQQPTEGPSGRSSNRSPNFTSTSLFQSGSAFHLFHLVRNGENDRLWESVGFVSSDGRTNLKTVLLPSQTLLSTSPESVKIYRVVTRPAKPFVFIDGPVQTADDCFVDTPCLEVRNSSPGHVTEVVEDFVSTTKRGDLEYTIHCCKGVSLEILGQLARDLNFEYVVYFMNDTNYGSYSTLGWTGMVGDVVNGAADIIAGAFSITSERMAAITFTDPYYQSDYAMVTGENGRSPSIWAFLSPFSAQVWSCIIISSIVAGVATSSLEWHSPFGLNPRGRKRRKQYSLGSGLLMVWVLVTGHTINIKAPKSWPSKVIQNVWAGLAIFIMTSYTANLAAFLAGQSATLSVTSIFDSKLLQKHVSLIRTSSVDAYIGKVNPDLSQIIRRNDVNSTEDGIARLQSGEIDMYLDDAALVEYAISRMDKDCKIHFVGKGFGTDGYAFGLPRNSWMRVPMSDRLMKYTESGFVQDLSRKYIPRSHCEQFFTGSAVKYGLAHTGGLFIILLSAMFVAVFFLILEHLAYRFLVPWLRSRPEGSFWKTENLAFISQRVHRVVRSERLYPQKQAAQEMIKIVKQRDFTRLIQKNELQKRKILPQQRVKTKAEVFQEITANIVSYHRQLREPDLGYPNADQEDDEGNLNSEDDWQSSAKREIPSPSADENHIGVANLAYHYDDEHADSVVDEPSSRFEVTDEDKECVNNNIEDEAVDKFDEGKEPSIPLSKRNSARSSSSSSMSSPRRRSSPASVGGSHGGSNGRRTSVFFTSSSKSEPTSPETSDPPGRLELSPSKGFKQFPKRSPLRRISDINPMPLANDDSPKNNSRRSRSQDYPRRDYFQRNLRLKDNRVKSTLRKHAMSGFQSQLPVDYLDECTLEALSKEDLVILWKKSELELQTKLNDVLNRNKRLALAIDYLTQQEFDDMKEEV